MRLAEQPMKQGYRHVLVIGMHALHLRWMGFGSHFLKGTLMKYNMKGALLVKQGGVFTCWDF